MALLPFLPIQVRPSWWQRISMLVVHQSERVLAVPLASMSLPAGPLPTALCGEPGRPPAIMTAMGEGDGLTTQ